MILDCRPPRSGTVLTVGTFDGVHRGHQRVLECIAKRGDELGLSSVLVTFDPHPLEIVRKEAAPPLLTLSTEKIEVIAESGINYVAIVPFTKKLQRYDAAAFVDQILRQRFHVKHLGDRPRSRLRPRTCGRRRGAPQARRDARLHRRGGLRGRWSRRRARFVDNDPSGDRRRRARARRAACSAAPIRWLGECRGAIGGAGCSAFPRSTSARHRRGSSCRLPVYMRCACRRTWGRSAG